MSKDKELTKAEYGRLLTAAKSKKNERLYYAKVFVWDSTRDLMPIAAEEVVDIIE